MTHVAVAPRIVNMTRFIICDKDQYLVINESHFLWQAQYLVSLDYDTCCSAHCK